MAAIKAVFRGNRNLSGPEMSGAQINLLKKETYEKRA
jgi:hypothetical protein